jgi:hypothetical protein
MFISITNFGAQASQVSDVNGIINSNTTWTQANSPYNLIGPVSISQGVTLTIEPGVTINLNIYYIQVNGTLTAVGTSSDPININGGSARSSNNPLNISPAAITFNPSSTNWSDQSNSGSIIENANMSSQIAIYNSPKIANTRGETILIYDGASLVSNNTQIGILVYGGTPTLSGNNITGGITVSGGSPTITNNTITDGPGYGIALGPRYDLDQSSKIYISENMIYGSFDEGCLIASGEVTVQGNLFVNTWHLKAPALSIAGSQSNFIIQNNTIEGSSTGLKIESSMTGSLTMAFNNIENISEYLIYCGSAKGFSVANNWWGTTNQSTINAAIYDFKNDFNIGTVSFTPYLTAPNPAAPLIPSSTPNPKPTTIPEFTSIISAMLLATVTFTAIIQMKKRKRERKLTSTF